MKRQLPYALVFCSIALTGLLLISCQRTWAQTGENSRADLAEKRKIFKQLLAQRENEDADVSEAAGLGKQARAAYDNGDAEGALRLLDRAIAVLQTSDTAGATASETASEEGFTGEGGGREVVPEASIPVPGLTPASPPVLQPSPGKLGRGVVLRWPSNPIQYADPYISIVQFDMDWAILEPQEGHYNWAELDGKLAEAQQFGKRVAVALWSHSYTGSRSTGVPVWCTCKKLTATYSGGPMGEFSKKKTMELTYPVKWDPIYIEKWSNFVKAFAKRYNDTFEYVQITETALPFQKRYGMPQRWEEAGFTLDVYKSAIQKNIDLFVEQFPKTQIMLGLNQPSGTSDAWLDAHPEDIKWVWNIAAYAASKKVGFINPGLRAWDNPPQRRFVWDVFRKYQGIVPLGMVINPLAVSRGNMTLVQVVEKGFGIAKVNYMIFPAYWLKQPNGPEAVKLAYEQIKEEKLN